MRLTDHLNLQGRSALFAGEGARANPYDAAAGAALERAAAELRIAIRSGIYAGLLGPAYETPAEIRALQALGAHAVGMSTVAEACAAHAAGMRVVGLSCIANPAAGIADVPLSHEDVLSAMRRAAGKLALLLERVAPAWSSLSS
jgi:purine-nucleoside phosphorylase